jgi:hypothetical protein
MELFKASHRHLIAAGARCDDTGVDDPRSLAQLTSESDTLAADQATPLPDEPVEKAALAKVLREVVPMIERLTKRVDEIARTPLPPLTMAKGTVSISKQQDREGIFGSGDPELSPETIAAASPLNGALQASQLFRKHARLSTPGGIHEPDPSGSDGQAPVCTAPW